MLIVRGSAARCAEGRCPFDSRPKIEGLRPGPTKLALSAILLVASLGHSSVDAIQPPLPRVFLLNAQTLAAAKQRIQSGDRSLDAALVKLEREARQALAQQPPSVVSKATTPPSGDKHDYMSQAPYFWPDPTRPNGLPYIRRDGERNPEINKISDHHTMDVMVAVTRTLALAYYFKAKTTTPPKPRNCCAPGFSIRQRA